MKNIQNTSQSEPKSFIFSKIFKPRKISLARISGSLPRRIKNQVKHFWKEIFKKAVKGCLTGF